LVLPYHVHLPYYNKMIKYNMISINYDKKDSETKKVKLMKQITVLKFLVVLLTVFLVNCQSFNPLIEDPRVSFNSVDIASIGLTGVNLVALVDVENPNSFSLPMPKIDWELFINDASVTNGVVENSQTIASREKVTLSFPVGVSYDRLLATFSSLAGAKETAYNIALDLRFPIPLLEYKVFKRNYSGVLPLRL